MGNKEIEKKNSKIISTSSSVSKTSAKEDDRDRRFCVTWYNYKIKKVEALKKHPEVKFLVFQSELCPETGRSHLQMYIEVTKQVRYAGLKKIFDDDQIHIIGCDGGHINNLYYCSKRSSFDIVKNIRYISDKNCEDPTFYWGRFDTREECTAYAKSFYAKIRALKAKKSPSERRAGHRSDLDALMAHLDQYGSYGSALQAASTDMKLHMIKYKQYCHDYMAIKPRKKIEWPFPTFRPWQQSVIDILEAPTNGREIHFIVDTKGGAGKSDLTNYLFRNYQAYLCMGAHGNIAKLYNFEQLLVCDSPRTANEFVNYGAIEQILTGIINSTKYEPEIKVRDNDLKVHALVFMNSYPDRLALSDDRYKVYNIIDNKLVNVTREFLDSTQIQLDALNANRQMLILKEITDISFFRDRINNDISDKMNDMILQIRSIIDINNSNGNAKVNDLFLQAIRHEFLQIMPEDEAQVIPEVKINDIEQDMVIPSEFLK